MPSTASLPACTGPAGSPHLQALPGLHQVGGPVEPPLVVALEGLQHQVQDAGERAEHLLPLFEPAGDVGGDSRGQEELHLLYHLLPQFGL